MPLEDPIQIPRVPLIDLPLEHSSYRASTYSYSDDFLTSWQCSEPDIVEENVEEDNKDEDYDIQSDNNSEASQMSQGSQPEDQDQPRSHHKAKAKFKLQYNVCFLLLRCFLAFLTEAF
jgi:hypothetical protein